MKPAGNPERINHDARDSQLLETLHSRGDKTDSHLDAGVVVKLFETALGPINDEVWKQMAPTTTAFLPQRETPTEEFVNLHQSEMVYSKTTDEIHRIHSEKIRATAMQAAEDDLVSML